MVARSTGLDLPLPLQFLAAWLAVWIGRSQRHLPHPARVIDVVESVLLLVA